MSNPLHADFYADTAGQHRVEVRENCRIAQDTYRLRFHCPPMARSILPGQFLMLRLADCNDPLIGRPLAMYDVIAGRDGQASEMDVVYLVKGKLTSALQRTQPGSQLDVWGPLGNGFLPQTTAHLIMVAGGIGQTPFLALAKEYLGLAQFGTPRRQLPQLADQVTFCYGALERSLLAGVEDFEALGVEVRIATDDGSLGHHGLVTDVLTAVLRESDDENRVPHDKAGTMTRSNPQMKRVVCCGPEPMMAAVAHVCEAFQTPCQVSLETPMACGVGICFTCVAEICDEKGVADFKRTCVEGPVFEAKSVVW